MNATETIIQIERYVKRHPNQRKGQAYFNGLWEVNPELADLITGSSVDSFYDDAKVKDLIAYLYETLDSTS